MRKLTSFAQNAMSGLLFTSIPIGAPTAAKVPPRLMLFECSSGLDLTVAIGKDVAKVSLPERALVLRHGSSQLGLRFSSNEGTLIIDGDFASLILRNDRRFGSCRSRGKAA